MPAPGSSPWSTGPAPVFRPTLEEFQDPLRYIASIRPQAEPYGICKVIPPEGWKPQFAIDKRRFRFRTRIQAVHELQERSASAKAAQAFYEDFNAFLKAHNKPLKKTPVYSGQEIDLCKLFRVVSRRGGYDQATEDKAWRDVCRILQVKDKSSNAAYTVRKLYQQHLLPYEAYCKVRPASTQPAAAKAAKKASSKSASPPAADHRQLSQSNEEIADAAEAAQILEAMLGMGSGHMEEDDDEEPPLKRLKLEDEVDPSRARSEAAADKIRVPDNIYELNCELCKGGHHEDKIILCDKCDRGCHMFCLTPPLEDVPEGEWICPLCLAEEADAFAFKDGHEFTLEDFQKQAATFKRDMFGGEAAARKVTDDELEAEFWRIVEEGEEPIEVWYGADLDTSIVGSGFPRKDVSDDPYAAAPWNLNNIPKLEGEYGSMLRHIEDNIQGVMVPWLYVGMLYSSFCWHIEDHMFYSINYHHWGEPKKWYGVPSSAAATFEDAFKKALPDHFEKQPDLLFHLVTMLSPKILRQHGVPVYSTVQEEGQFVITFPNSYHGGFNQGFNCAEAVNFASADWLRYGAPSCQRYRSFRKPSLIAHEWLLLKVAKEDRDPRTAFFVRQDLLRVIAEEREWRSRLWSQGVRRARRITQPVGMDKGASDDAECAICHMYVHCSAVECDCCPRRRVCLHHAHNLCECEPARWRLAFRYSLADLERILEDVTRNAGDYEEACAEPLLNGQFPASPIDPDGERADGENADSAEHENGDQGSGSQSERDYSPEPVLRKKYPTRGSIKAEVEALEALDPFSALADLAAFAEKEADQKSPRSARTSPAKQNGRPSSSRSLSPPCKLAEEEETEAPGATTPPPMEAEPAAIEVKPETPDVQKQVTAWQQQLHEQHQAWHARAKQVLEVGGAKVAELDALIVETEQYAWGGAEFEDVPPVLARLRQAKAWVAQVNGFVKNKPTLEAVAPVLAWDPAPVYVSGFVKLKEGAAGAQAWLGRAAEVLADKHVVELRVLEALVTEASRFPISLPDSKVLRERLTAARKVAEAIRLALPTGSGRVKRKGEEQLNMQHLRDLRVQAGALRVDMAELATLSNTLERLDAFQRKIKAALTIKPALVQLQELEAEAETLPVAVPEMDAVAALMQKASDWLGRASALAQQRAPLKKMREVLHAGLRLAVEIPAVESLRLEIRRREWEETAKKALSGRFTLTALLETLEDAPAYGAAQTDLARNLQAKADKAQEWDASATAFFAAVEAAAAAAQQGTAGSLGQANGDALGGQRAVGEAKPINTATDAARPAEALAGQQRAAEAQPTDMAIETARAAEAEACAKAETAVAMEVDSSTAPEPSRAAETAETRPAAENGLASSAQVNGPVALPIGAKASEQATSGDAVASRQEGAGEAAPLGEAGRKAAKDAEAAAEAPAEGAPAAPAGHAVPAQKPFLAELEALVEAGKGVAVKLESLTKANQLLNAANNWLRQAQRCLVEGYEPEDQPSLSQIEKLIDASENLSVSMAETALLVAKRDQARAWISKAQTVLDEPSSQDVLETLQALVEEGGAVELQMDELEELQRRILALGWAKKTRHLLAAAAAAARPQSRATHHHQHAQHAGHQVYGNGGTAQAASLQPMAAQPQPLGVAYAPSAAPVELQSYERLDGMDGPGAEQRTAASSAGGGPPLRMPVVGEFTAAMLAAVETTPHFAVEGPPPAPNMAGSLQHAGQHLVQHAGQHVGQHVVGPHSTATMPAGQPLATAAGVAAPPAGPLYQHLTPTGGAAGPSHVALPQFSESLGIAEELPPLPEIALPDEPAAAAPGASGVQAEGARQPDAHAPEPVAAAAAGQGVSAAPAQPSAPAACYPVISPLQAACAALPPDLPLCSGQPAALLSANPADAAAGSGLVALPQRMMPPAPPGGNGQVAASHSMVTPAPAPAPAAAPAPRPPRPSLAEALALVAEGRQLPVDQLLLMQLTRLTDTAQDWEARVYNALVGRRAEAGAAQVKWTSVGELTALLGEGRSLGLRLEGLPRLHATLEDHQAWEGRMRLVMTAGTGKPMYEQLAALQDASADNPVASALQAQVYGAVAAADEWREKGRRYIAKRNSGQRLDKGLAHLASSLARALDQLDHRLQEERRRAEAGLPAPEPVAEVAPSSSQASKKRKASPSPERYEENEQDLFCVCQQPYNVDTAMISCDTCNDWYHLRCVNMTQAVAKSLKKYTCPVCAALKGNGAELEAAVAKIRKTRCPDRVALAELLAEAKALACQVEELPALTHVVSAFDRWQGAVEAALEVHESAIEPQEPGPAAAGMRLSPAVLAQLLKSTLSLEIDCSALMKRIMSDLRSERWRTKAEQALRPNSKATVEVLLKLVKEAEGLGISLAHDRTGAQLAQRANAGRQWLDRCRDVLADLKVKGQAEAVLLQRIADAEKLAEEAPSLGVRVDKELERLQECAKLYCLCRQPYDEQRPMLSCDYCQDWFHYECVGLNAPNDDEEDEEVAPEDYRCPNCCAKMRLPYPLYEKLPIRSQQQLLRQAVAAHAAAEQQQQQQGASGAQSITSTSSAAHPQHSHQHAQHPQQAKQAQQPHAQAQQQHQQQAQHQHQPHTQAQPHLLQHSQASMAMPMSVMHAGPMSMGSASHFPLIAYQATDASGAHMRPVAVHPESVQQHQGHQINRHWLLQALGAQQAQQGAAQGTVSYLAAPQQASGRDARSGQADQPAQHAQHPQHVPHIIHAPALWQAHPVSSQHQQGHPHATILQHPQPHGGPVIIANYNPEHMHWPSMPSTAQHMTNGQPLPTEQQQQQGSAATDVSASAAAVPGPVAIPQASAASATMPLQQPAQMAPVAAQGFHAGAAHAPSSATQPAPAVHVQVSMPQSAAENSGPAGVSSVLQQPAVVPGGQQGLHHVVADAGLSGQAAAHAGKAGAQPVPSQPKAAVLAPHAHNVDPGLPSVPVHR